MKCNSFQEPLSGLPHEASADKLSCSVRLAVTIGLLFWNLEFSIFTVNFKFKLEISDVVTQVEYTYGVFHLVPNKILY